MKNFAHRRHPPRRLTGPVRDGKNARRQDTIACMKYIAQRAATETPNVTIIAGDLFNRSRVWADTALDDVNDAITEFIRPLCRSSEHVVLLFGTENHDNPRAFETVREITKDEKNLHIYTAPGVEKLTTSAGPVQILALPASTKAACGCSAPERTRRPRTATLPRSSTTFCSGFLRSSTRASRASSWPITPSPAARPTTAAPSSRGRTLSYSLRPSTAPA